VRLFNGLSEAPSYNDVTGSHTSDFQPGTGAPPGASGTIQALDGIGAGLQGPLFAIMVADLTRGSGRYNVAMGAATMVQGIGGALSPTLAGAVALAAGYNAAMLTLTAIALVALALLVVAVPETLHREAEPPQRPLQPPAGPVPEPTLVG
ncbi:MAG: MFS transporter, partial [Actinomycetota bacterium]|nr:MFS transporter [Actinomycetota bacterium]